MILSLSHNECTNVITCLGGCARVGSAITVRWVERGQLQARVLEDLL
jgi:hypothetical protein